MITHILKIIWNQRRQNAFTWVELIIVFVVLFLTIDFIAVHVRLYIIPLGMNVENVWQLRLVRRDYKDATTEADRKAYFAQVEQLVEAIPGVECATKLKNFPFLIQSLSARGFDLDSTRHVSVIYEEVTDKYLQTVGLELVHGRWFTKEEVEREAGVMVITSNVADALLHKDSILGPTKRFGEVNGVVTPEIIGVVRPVKFEDFQSPKFIRYTPSRLDRFFWGFPKMAIRVRPGIKNFSEKFREEIVKHTRIAEFGILPLESAEMLRQQTNRKVTNQIVIYGVVTGFLLLTIFLGIGGIFWKRVLMRRAEIGLKMAMGATSQNVKANVTMEVVCLVLLAFIPGALICSNLAYAELLNAEYFPVTAWRVLFDMGITLLLLLTMAILSTRYPARLAARMQPVEALRSE